MKAIMLTIRLKWFYLTYKGIKTIEVRKTAPKDFVGDVYEVVSKTNFEKDLMEIPESERDFFKQFKGKVGLKLTLNKVEKFTNDELWERLFETDLLIHKSCVSFPQLMAYSSSSSIYAWHIDNLVIFDKPKELSEFKRYHEKKDEHSPCWTCKRFGTGCMSCRLTKAPQSWCYVEVE